MNFIRYKRIISKISARLGLEPRLYRRLEISGRLSKNGRINFPVSLTIEPTFRCNLHCFMCFQGDFRRAEKEKLRQWELTTSDWTNFLKRSRALIGCVGLTGGEIFIRNDIFDIFDCLEELKIPFNIVTNGVLINNSKAERLTKYRNLHSVCFSIHGDGKTHDQIVGVDGSFSKIMDMVNRLKGKHFWVSANCVISEANVKELPVLVGTCALAGFDSLGFQLENFSTQEEQKASQIILKQQGATITQTSKKGNYSYPLSDLLTSWSNALKISRQKSFPITFTPPLFYSEPSLVYLANYDNFRHDLFCEDLKTIRINPEGNVSPCQFLPMTFGNITKQPLDEIGNSKEFTEYRRELLRRNLVPICKRCCKLKAIKKFN